MKRPGRRHIVSILSRFMPYLSDDWRELVSRQIHPKNSRAREGVKQYLRPDISVESFFRRLDDEGIRVVVLRWFETLPHVEPGHDLDILIADNAVDRVQAMMSCWPEGQRVDCYSETGVDGTGYLPPSAQNAPAFPSDIAATILGTARRCEGGWWVPGPREHALALAYHAIYLKGYASGLPPDNQTAPTTIGSHDYSAVLTELTARTGIPLEQPVTMWSLDRMLAREGWRPPPDHLRQLAARNPWIDSELL